MNAILKKFYSPVMFDAVFALAAVISVIGIILGSGRPFPAIGAADQPLIKGGAALAVMLAAAATSMVTTRLDQRCADDFVFRTLTKSAFQGFMGFVLAAVFWELLFANSMGSLSPMVMVTLALGSWSMAYFLTRWKGTGA